MSLSVGFLVPVRLCLLRSPSGDLKLLFSLMNCEIIDATVQSDVRGKQQEKSQQQKHLMIGNCEN